MDQINNLSQGVLLQEYKTKPNNARPTRELLQSLHWELTHHPSLGPPSLHLEFHDSKIMRQWNRLFVNVCECTRSTSAATTFKIRPRLDKHISVVGDGEEEK